MMRNRRLWGKRQSIKSVKLGTIPFSQQRTYWPATKLGPQFHLPASQRVNPDDYNFVDVSTLAPPKKRKPYSSMTLRGKLKIELLEIANDKLGLGLAKKTTKDDLIEAILNEQSVPA